MAAVHQWPWRRLVSLRARFASGARSLDDLGRAGGLAGPEFDAKSAHAAWLAERGPLPRGFTAGAAALEFRPRELEAATSAALSKPMEMNLALMVLDEPTPDWSACFTKNRFPGAPVKVGRRRVEEAGPLRAILVNNKISNVCGSGDGVADSEALCDAVAAELGGGADPTQILPCSTGVIGWRLPTEEMAAALPGAVRACEASADSVVRIAEAIMTTDRFAKARSAVLPGEGGARIVGVAKGAGMIEPNMATMLVFVLTDAVVPGGQRTIKALLAEAVERTFNCISIDSDTSTSDTVVLASSSLVAIGGADDDARVASFRAALNGICAELAADVVRNGEGVRHVIRVAVANAPSVETARTVGKAIVNSPLFKCAVAGNDPNVGRLMCAIGDVAATRSVAEDLDLEHCAISLGGREIFRDGRCVLPPDAEVELSAHFAQAELGDDSVPLDFPPHERVVEVAVTLGGADAGDASCTVVGADLTHEYVAENADYRS